MRSSILKHWEKYWETLLILRSLATYCTSFWDRFSPCYRSRALLVEYHDQWRLSSKQWFLALSLWLSALSYSVTRRTCSVNRESFCYHAKHLESVHLCNLLSSGNLRYLICYGGVLVYLAITFVLPRGRIIFPQTYQQGFVCSLGQCNRDSCALWVSFLSCYCVFHNKQANVKWERSPFSYC